MPSPRCARSSAWSRHRDREFVLADIPGLIDGAAEGAGIGDRFLGHIERCRVLIHLVDIAGADPAEAMQVIEDELAAYGAGLDDKPRLIALNKIDLADAELVDGLHQGAAARPGPKQVFPISGATGEGIERAARRGARRTFPPRTVTERPDGEREDGRRAAVVADLISRASLVTSAASRLVALSPPPCRSPASADLADTAACPRLVVKVGSSLLVGRTGAAARLARGAGRARSPRRAARGQEVIVVSSGAIALGAATLGLDKGGRGSLADAQAAAAVGQIALSGLWAELLGRARADRRAAAADARRPRGPPPLPQRHRHAQPAARRRARCR